MFMSLLMPYLPPTQEAFATPPAIFQTSANTAKPDMVFDGGCLVAQSLDNPIEPGVGEPGDFFPTDAVYGYYQNVRHIDLNISKAKVSIVTGPQHGALVQLSSKDAEKLGVGPESSPPYRYRPNSGYLGPDDATLLIELDGKGYKIHTKFYVVNKVNDNNWYGTGTPATLCAESQSKRMASLTFNQDINLAEWGDIVQEIATATGGLEFNQYIASASGVTLSFADLSGGAVGQTTGSNITLDDNAAGYGWFIDPNPNEWVAKAVNADGGKCQG